MSKFLHLNELQKHLRVWAQYLQREKRREEMNGRRQMIKWEMDVDTGRGMKEGWEKEEQQQ